MNRQKIARITGWLFIATFVTAIPARLLFLDGLGGSWDDLRFLAGAGSDTSIYLGAIFEFLVIATNIGTAVVLYPILKRRSEIGAVGYVTARLVECAFILVGLLSVLSVVTLRQDLAGAAGAEAASMVAAGTSLVSTYEWAFLFGPGLLAGIGNGILLGYLMYRSGLVPRRMAALGLVGGPLLIVAFVCVLFGVFDAGSTGQVLLTVVEIVWELSLGIYLIVKGFKSSPEAVGGREEVREPSMAVA